MRAVWLVVLAACGDNIGALTIDEYPAAYHDVVCDRGLACGTVVNRADCDLPNVAEWRPDPRYLDAVHDGRIAWDPIAAYDCLASVTDSCDWTSEDYRGDHCDRITHGTLVEGEGCMVDAECVSNECWNERCEEACCAGVCVGSTAPQPGRIGEPCRTEACAEGYCDSGFCAAFVAEGGECTSSFECAYGFGCKAQRCAVIPDRGEPCAPSADFEECRRISDHCSTVSYRCEPRRFGGSTCVGDTDCAGLYRCVEHRCVLSRSELDGRCDYTNDCATPGAVCSFGICILPRAAGERCTWSEECESNLCDTAGLCESLDGCL